MLAEALAMIALILLIFGISFRKSGPEFALAALPFVIVPLCYLGGYTMQWAQIPLFRWQPNEVGALLVAIGMVVSCVLFGILAARIRNRALRLGYIVLCIGFTVAFGWLFLRSFL